MPCHRSVSARCQRVVAASLPTLAPSGKFTWALVSRPVRGINPDRPGGDAVLGILLSARSLLFQSVHRSRAIRNGFLSISKWYRSPVGDPAAILAIPIACRFVPAVVCRQRTIPCWSMSRRSILLHHGAISLGSASILWSFCRWPHGVVNWESRTGKPPDVLFTLTFAASAAAFIAESLGDASHHGDGRLLITEPLSYFDGTDFKLFCPPRISMFTLSRRIPFGVRLHKTASSLVPRFRTVGLINCFDSK